MGEDVIHSYHRSLSLDTWDQSYKMMEKLMRILRIGYKWDGLNREKASGVICDCKVPTKLKGKFYRIAVRLAMLYGSKCWALKGLERKVGV